METTNYNTVITPIPTVHNLDADTLQRCKSKCGGIKFDTDKPRFTLLDAGFIEQLAIVMTYGAIKYGDFNWKGLDPDRVLNSAFRHLNAIAKGNLIDEESGYPHSTHVAANMMMYQWLIDNTNK